MHSFIEVGVSWLKRAWPQGTLNGRWFFNVKNSPTALNVQRDQQEDGKEQNSSFKPCHVGFCILRAFKKNRHHAEPSVCRKRKWDYEWGIQNKKNYLITKIDTSTKLLLETKTSGGHSITELKRLYIYNIYIYIYIYNLHIYIYIYIYMQIISFK